VIARAGLARSIANAKIPTAEIPRSVACCLFVVISDPLLKECFPMSIVRIRSDQQSPILADRPVAFQLAEADFFGRPTPPHRPSTLGYLFSSFPSFRFPKTKASNEYRPGPKSKNRTAQAR
jgi:hypothetical protein